MRHLADLFALVHGSGPHRPVPAIWDFAPCHASLVGGIPDLPRYYFDVSEKLSCQLRLGARFPEALVLPGIWPDLGVVIEASGFGGRVTWLADGAPHISPSLMKLNDIDTLRMPDPKVSGLMPLYRVQAQQMQAALEGQRWESAKVIVSMGPAEIAGLILGYERFYLGMYDDARRIGTLMEMLTEFLILWLRTQEEVVGRADLLILGDHVLSQVKPELVASLICPSIAAIYEAFPYAVKMYHNEGHHSKKHISLIQRLGFDIWHFGSDQHRVDELLPLLDERITLFGGLNPHGVLRKGTPDDVAVETRECLRAARGRRILLSSGTGTTPDVPPENVQAMVDTTVVAASYSSLDEGRSTSVV